MRILFVTDYVHLPQQVGGSETSVHDLCLALLRRGIPVAVLASLAPEGLLGLRTRIIHKLSRHRKFPSDRLLGYPVFRGWFPIKGVAQVIRTFQPTVAVCQGYRPVALAQACMQAGLPALIYLRNFGNFGGSLIAHPLLRYATNSRFSAARFKSDFGIDAAVIPPLVLSERYRTPTTRRKALFVNPGVLKGVEIAVHLARSRSDIPFEFVECWRYPPEKLSEWRTRAGAVGNIMWRKWTADMRRFYREARIVLVPSLCDEAWGRVVTEAQVSGIPVLASNRGGLPESVGPGGILVDPEGDLSEWERALSQLWDDPAEYHRHSRAALHHSQRPEIQPDYLISRLIDVIESMLSAAAPDATASNSSTQPSRGAQSFSEA